MYREYGLFASVLLLPHMIIGVILRRLANRQSWRHFAVVAATYLMLWFLTYVWGGRQVHAILEMRILDSGSSVFYERHGPFRRLKSSRIDEYSPNWNEKPPWYYIAHASSPCPFIVTTDYGAMEAPTVGWGAKAYFVWCFGLTYRLRDQFHWAS
jgi:hypothetical protein